MLITKCRYNKYFVRLFFNRLSSAKLVFFNLLKWLLDYLLNLWMYLQKKKVKEIQVFTAPFLYLAPSCKTYVLDEQFNFVLQRQ